MNDAKNGSMKEDGVLLLFVPSNSTEGGNGKIGEAQSFCCNVQGQERYSMEEGTNALGVMVTNGSLTFRGQ